MLLYRQSDPPPDAFQQGAIAIGNFDGVHQGHAKILEKLRSHAAIIDGPAVVLTFEPHPVRLLRPEHAPPSLCWLERKAELIGRLGVDCVWAYPTDLNLLSLSAEAFFERIVVDSLDARAVVEGPNFHFGKDRQGDVSFLDCLCRDRGIVLDVVEPVAIDGDKLASSSRIREWIASGNIESANQYLTAPYRIRGRVAHGAARGAELGFPTANLSDMDTLLPAPGVYAGAAWVGPKQHLAAINIGPKPTFGEEQSTVEAHLLDFDGDLYDSLLEVDFWERVREIQTFPDVAALRQAIASDVQTVRTCANRWAAR